MRALVCLLIFWTMVGTTSTSYAREALSDSQIRQAIIQQSLSTYPGNCPCPYNTDRAGRSCGKRSAYSKPGGYAPLCYSSDVSDEMVSAYRAKHKAEEQVLSQRIDNLISSYSFSTPMEELLGHLVAAISHVELLQLPLLTGLSQHCLSILDRPKQSPLRPCMH